ncbi:hypothetical protein ACFLXC_07210, partial [Chloroflexota bacterium]
EDKGLIEAGKAFAGIQSAQYKAIKNSPLDRRSYRIKALVPSVLASYSFVAGLLQSHPDRLQIHLAIPELAKGAVDPLNAQEMANFKHYQDSEGQRGLGIRASLKDRQRMAQVFLARTVEPDGTLNKTIFSRAVNQVVALKFFSKGYTQ